MTFDEPVDNGVGIYLDDCFADLQTTLIALWYAGATTGEIAAVLTQAGLVKSLDGDDLADFVERSLFSLGLDDVEG